MRIIPKIFNDIKFNKISIDFLKESNVISGYNNSLEKNIKTEFEHVPTLFDLYKFKGITYTNNEADATPAEVYEELTPDAWTFILPVYGYRVESGVDPAVLTGASPWEFITTICIVKSKIHYINLSDNLISKARIINYLYTADNSPLPTFKILIDPINDLYADYTYFYRWVKSNDEWDLEFYAFYPYYANVLMSTSIYFIDKGLSNGFQSNTITIKQIKR
jgi:hypothetical protein